jgi:hypothetical protein
VIRRRRDDHIVAAAPREVVVKGRIGDLHLEFAQIELGLQRDIFGARYLPETQPSVVERSSSTDVLSRHALRAGRSAALWCDAGSCTTGC